VYEAGFAARGGPFSGAIMVIDTAFDQMIGTIATGAFYPTILAVDPVRPQLYAIGRNGTSVQVLVFNTLSRQQAGSVAIPANALYDYIQGVVVTPDGKRLYVAAGHTLTALTLPEATLALTTTLDFEVSGIALSLDGSELYIGNENQGRGVTVVSTADLQTIRTITRFPNVVGVATRPLDGALLAEVDTGGGFYSQLAAMNPESGALLALSTDLGYSVTPSIAGDEIYRVRSGDCPEGPSDYACNSRLVVVLDSMSLAKKGEITLDTRAPTDPSRRENAVVATFVTSMPKVSLAVEYYDPVLGHYFTTSLPVEINALDSGVFPGWQRTGETLPVYAQRADGADGTVAVCRFYGLPEKGLDSHFYSASATECAQVQQRFGDSWLLESSDVFDVYLADVATGACPFETTPVYRVYNNRPDANHRYTTSLAIRDSMVQAGWIPEGYGLNAVAFCVPR
jgi:DNA-binding beta-propeller fold protein YncE